MPANIWPAPSKLNLFLHIIGKRSDGYHEIQTVFQILEFGDELQFLPSENNQVNLTGNYTGVNQKDDLIFRAAELLRLTTGIKHGICISVNKRIPMGGGLGGGSTNAATTLVALNQIWSTGLSITELAELGLKLGADVPIFIHGQSAWAEGVGEKLTPLTLPEDWFLIIHPGCSVNTREIFEIPDLTRNTSPITIRDFDAGCYHNDFEVVVYRKFPEIEEAAAWLGKWTKANLTGTGACIYGRFENKQSAIQAFNNIPGKWQGFVSKGLNTSPLMGKLVTA
jgi:4-diphosphocytidyl-2-C-methyl-D-erythritol kinase